MLDILGLGNAAVAKLADVAELNPRLKAKLSPDETVAFVPMAALSSERASVVAEEARPYREVAKGYTPFQDGDVLVAKITPCFENSKIGQANLSRPIGFGSTEFHVIRPYVDRADSRYLMHYLRQGHVLAEGERKMTGSAGQRRVPEHFIADLTVLLPAVSEQRRIAAVLDQADALRAKRRAALARLDELTRAIFVETFGDLRANSMNWPTVPVGEYVSKFQGGKSIEADGDNRSAKHRVLKVSAVTSMVFQPTESKPLSENYTPLPEHFLQNGDLLFSRANTTELVGAVAYVPNAPSNLLLPDKLWRFVWRSPVSADPLFIWALFQTPMIREEIGRRATGTSGSMKNISQEKLLAMPTILPPLSVQQAFARRFRKLEEIKAQQLLFAVEMDHLFASLQHRAFTGAL